MPNKDPFKPTRKEKREQKRRLKNAPDLNKPEPPFHIDKDGNEYSKEQYYNEFGASKYKESVKDKSLKRRTKIKR